MVSSKKIILLMFLLIAVFTAIHLIPDKQTADISETKNKKIVVTATIFPVYDVAKYITGDRGSVKMMLPPGVEPHSYDPSPKDIISLKRSKIFIYSSPYMESWVEKIIPQIGKNCIPVNGSEGVIFINGDMHERHGDEGMSHNGVDPHIWLDPANMKIIAENFAEALIKADPVNEDYYSIRLDDYKKQMDKLDNEIADSVKKLKNRTIIYGGHYAFGYLSKKYGLNYTSPYKNFSPNSEPTPKDIKEMIDTVKSSKVKYIFYEEMLSPKIAEIAAKECQVSLLMLNGTHNVSKDDLSAGITYVEIMRKNLENLKKGLDSIE